MFDNREDILKFLIEYQLFAPSVSAFATRLVYNNRVKIYRLVNGKIKKVETIDQIWNNVCENLGVSGERLVEMAVIAERAKWFLNLTDDYPFDKKDSLWSERILRAFVDKDYTSLPKSFVNEILPLLEDLKKDNEEVFFSMLMLFYVKANKLNPYKLSFTDTLAKLIIHLNEYFHSLHPENNVAYTAIQALTANKILENISPCLWGLVENPTLILQYYADPLFINSVLRMGTVFTEWDDISYWHASGADFRKGQSVWMFMCRESDSIYHGSYIVQEFEIGKDNETFIPRKLCSILFWNKEDEDEDYDSIIQISNLISSDNDVCKFSYGLYKYCEESQEIQIVFDTEDDNIYQLPDCLKRIRIGYPYKEKGEKIWSHFIKKFDDGEARTIFSKNLCDTLNVEYLDDEYKILDVNISRKYFSLLIKQNNQPSVYRIPIDAYAFLKGLSVFEEVTVCRHTQQLCIEWPWLGYAIPMSEFETIEKDNPEKDTLNSSIP